MKSPPSRSDLEVVLLGPGYGESIVIHIGNSQWIIVDSCINSDRKSAPLEYLKSIGVNPLDVVLIIASHWHDDHVKGLFEVVDKCQNAKFCCSVALTKDEFMANVASYSSNDVSRWTSGVDEYYKILKALSEKPSSPIRATNNKRVYQSIPEAQFHCEVWSLSPSDKEVELFLKEIGNITPIEGDPKKRMHVTRNNVSLVIHLSIDKETILLGSDLEETTNANTGWSVIVDSTEKPASKAKIFKVPHHGSSNAHSGQVWEEMVVNNAYALLTPYNRGRKKLPSKLDVSRILDCTKNSFSTVLSTSKKVKKRNKTVEKIIKESVGEIRSFQNEIGMIRLRKSADGVDKEWQLELFNGACNLQDMKFDSPTLKTIKK